ncbi:MAG: hypothetical protein ABSE42_18700 [Bryobacteraceae bacterium]|jgi:hypothetical protein
MPDFNKMLRAKSMALLKSYALHPADNIEGYRGDTIASTQTTLKQGAYHSGVIGQIQKKLASFIPAFRPKMIFSKSIDFKAVGSGKKVALVNLVKRDPSKPGNEGAETVDVFGSFAINPNSGWVPSYYLPWDESGTIVHMTIPKQGTISSESHILDPDIFFTAAINGCSIFIQGTPESPTVYHAGGDTGRGDDLARGAAFWREVLTNFADSSKGKFQTEVNKMDYIKTPGQVGSDGKPTTANANAYEKWLQDKYKKTLDVKFVTPWGCVVGYRNAGKWAFYLQENATIAYMTLRKEGKEPAKLRLVSKPMVLREIFPGSGAVNMTNSQGIMVTST